MTGKRCPILILCICCSLLVLCSCSPGKHISKGSYLLSKNKIDIRGNNYNIKTGDLVNYVQQDPNHKILYMKVGMYIYSASRPIDDSACNFFEKYICRSIGEKPVELSERHVSTSCKNIKTYLKSNGCFSATVQDSLSRVRRWYAPWTFYKKRRVENYIVEIPYRAKIDTFYLSTEAPKLYEVVNPLIKKDLIKKGDWYNEQTLSQIRNDVTAGMQDKGYYAFNTSHISFEVDTAEGYEKTKIRMYIKNPMDNNNIATVHKPYRISKVFIQPNYIPITSSDYLPPIDTVLTYHKSLKTGGLTPLFFINNTKEPIIKRKTLQRCILMRGNRMYSPKVSKNTYSALFQLKNFKYVDMYYEPIGPFDADTLNLASHIRLTMIKPISLSSSFEINYSANNNNNLNYGNSSNFGAAGNLSFTHRNLFRGAEIFTTNLKLAAEINSKVFSGESDARGWKIFNAFEAGLDFGLELPRFLAPFSTKFYSMRFHPHTSIEAGYNFQKRSYYNRSIFNMDFGYSWNSSSKKYFYFTPIEINYVNMNITDENYQALINTMDRRIRYQMSDHFVMAMRFSYVYNGQNIGNKKNFNYFTVNMETAGNVLELYSGIVNQSKDNDGNYTIFNIPFSQYVRGDFSFIRYNYLSKRTSLVCKIFGGIGVSYGNAEALPYEKSFFGGGANNLRGWQLRELGPGSSQPTGKMKHDRAGDLTFGASVEYRFPIVGPLEGAMFMDAGNIWTLKDVAGMEGGKIGKDFYKEIACDLGLGFRLNISVMLIRVDFALKAWDPCKDVEDRFVLDDARFKDISVQFGIGYPF